ncbi:hypothetical protein Vadar_005599 [Vaccinium darrowii]|uniref:Uncharacterized protein n=1 Tax=Vaccinium darrowii TaxID=229202 RepID=A0ACB7YLI9_9ERIC|nr:hypothetical protein Vadar_005599 [Vaccinium darrowii]
MVCAHSLHLSSFLAPFKSEDRLFIEHDGIWIGMLSGMGVQILALAWMVWRTDWDLQVCKAIERLSRWFLKPSEELDESLIA